MKVNANSANSTFTTALPDPDIMFSQDLLAAPSLAPQLTDPDRIATIEVFARGAFPDRKPVLTTPRTDVYITAWDDKDLDDPFYQD